MEISLSPDCLVQCLAVSAVNKLFHHEFQPTSVLSKTDKEIRLFPPSTEADLDETNQIQLILNSHFLQGRGTLFRTWILLEKRDYVFHQNNEHFCHSKHFQKENKAFSDNVSVLIHQSCQSKSSLTAKRWWENKRRGLFYTTRSTDSSPQAMGLLSE